MPAYSGSPRYCIAYDCDRKLFILLSRLGLDAHPQGAWPGLVFSGTVMASSIVRVLSSGSYFVHPQEVVCWVCKADIAKHVDC